MREFETVIAIEGDRTLPALIEAAEAASSATSAGPPVRMLPLAPSSSQRGLATLLPRMRPVLFSPPSGSAQLL